MHQIDRCEGSACVNLYLMVNGREVATARLIRRRGEEPARSEIYLNTQVYGMPADAALALAEGMVALAKAAQVELAAMA